MKRAGTASQRGNGQKKAKRSEVSPSPNTVFGDHMSETERKVIEAFETENSVIEDLEAANNKLKDEVRHCETVIKERDGQIEQLHKEKPKKKQEKVIIEYEEEKFNKTLEEEVIEYRMEKQSSDEMIKKKPTDAVETGKRLIGDQSKYLSMQKHFEGELKLKEIERKKLNLEIINKEEDVELHKQQNESLRAENQNLKEDVELIKRQKETLNNEYRKLEILIQSKDELIRTKDDQIIAVGEKFEV